MGLVQRQNGINRITMYILGIKRAFVIIDIAKVKSHNLRVPGS